MPYGFIKDLEKMGKSQSTLNSYERRISNFISFLNERYKTKIEVYQIKPIDIREYISSRRELGVKDSTLVKDFGVIKQFFDFLWRTNQVPVDFVSKMKFDFNVKKKTIHALYKPLLEASSKICTNPRLKNKAKVLFSLSMKGFHLKEIRFLSPMQVKDNGETLTISVQRKKYGPFSVTLSESWEVQPLRECIAAAEQEESDFILFSINKDGECMALSKSSVSYLWFSIEKTIESIVGEKHYNINTTTIRYAYIYYLFKEEHHSVESISTIMGITLATASELLNDAILRVEKTNDSMLYGIDEEQKMMYNTQYT